MSTESRYSSGVEYWWNFGVEWSGVLKIWSITRVFGHYSGVLLGVLEKVDTQEYQEK